MNTEFAWGRILYAILILVTMFLVPVIVVWRDQRRDLRRFGPDATSRPVRYAPDGQAYREGLAMPFSVTQPEPRKAESATGKTVEDAPEARTAPIARVGGGSRGR
ncbi:hypothetical protein MXD59_11520 [Frankia sp. Ag45/Mut15]|uniref:Uncharacterized protein n=1 Tax=Frankia umida TaxID=573489 RepID=A0ABT0JZG0_9ACTN|nr:hypothetical protein [Frankia umida]MCK9876393.1 hypothetical protein [Frankia umida]